MATPPIAKPASAGDKLRKLREIQNWGQSFGVRTPDSTSPNMCIAASKFLVARLSGLFAESAGHLNDFLHSPQARRLAPAIDQRQLKSLWGSPLHAFDEDVLASFNARVMPALLDWGRLKAGCEVKFVAHPNCAAQKADALLHAQVPLVIGVHHHDGRSPRGGRNNHYIAVVKGGTGEIWAIDSWGSEAAGSVVCIKPMVGMSFRVPLSLSMNVNGDSGRTTLPGSNLLVGHYEEGGRPLKLALAL